MGNKLTQQNSSSNFNSKEDYEIAIKHFPIIKQKSIINGTLTLNVIDPFKMLFLDPTSLDGYEKVELDMKVIYAGKMVYSEKIKYQKR